MKIIMAEFKDVRYDARVLKQAHSLANNGYKVTLLMFNSSIRNNRRRKFKNLEFIEFSFTAYTKINNRLKRVIRYLAAVKKILEINIYILLHKADIYHAHNLKFLISSIVSSSIHHGKLVYDSHELHSAKHPTHRVKNRLLNKFNYYYEKMALSYVNLFIQASIERANYVASLYKIPKPLVIENHINLGILKRKKHSIRKSIGLFNNEIILVYVGGIRFGGNHKIEKIIESLSLLKENIHFALIGPSRSLDKENIINYSKQCNVENRVHILEPVPYQKIINAISSADLSVIPLYADSLNTKMSALNKISESCMAGLPIVCSNYENLERIINNNPIGKIGYTFDINSVNSIVDAINNCLLPENREKFRKNSLELARKFYNWENEEKKLINAYSRLKVQ